MPDPIENFVAGFPDYEIYSKSGVDLTLLRERLKLTVTERWERNAEALKMVQAFREAGRVRRGETAESADRRES